MKSFVNYYNRIEYGKKKKKESSIVYEKPVREDISQDRSGS